MPEKIWLKIKAEISEQIIHEPVLASFLSKRVNQHDLQKKGKR